MNVFLLLLGLLILTCGADILIRGASAIALRLKMSELLIGLTIVAFGTSAPELAVSIKSALAGQGGIALGNVIGSNVFNTTLILGITALLCPLRVELSVIRKELPLLLGVSAVFSMMVVHGEGLNRISGMILTLGLLAYIVHSFYSGQRAKGDIATLEAIAIPEKSVTMKPVVSILLIFLGLGMLVFGGDMFVKSAVSIAKSLGVSETVIGLTVVAAGTSLPELAASTVAAIRGKADMAIGNIVGSNMFNMLCIGGISSLIKPLSTQFGWMDLMPLLVTSALLLPLMRTGFNISRKEGLFLIVCFGGYLFLVWPK